MERMEPQPIGPAILMDNVAVGSLQDPATSVLTGVNWTVSQGEFWVLAGLQGSGKSDLLMLTAGLMTPLSGRYCLFGHEMPILEEERLSERLRLGLVFESGQLFNHLTVRENLALPLRYHRNLSMADAAETVQAVLDALELGPLADNTPGALGRNWHKRVGLGRALMLKPDILLLDNPLTGLDLRHMNWWLTLLQRLSKEGNFIRGEPLTLVATTADLRPWIGLAGHFAVFKYQKLTVLGDRSQLEAASNELVGELLAPEHRNE